MKDQSLYLKCTIQATGYSENDMDIFDLREKHIRDYSAYTQHLIKIKDQRIRDHVQDKLQRDCSGRNPDRSLTRISGRVTGLTS